MPKSSKPPTIVDIASWNPIPVVDNASMLTVEEFCAEFRISKDTFYHWRKVGSAPVCHRLPNGGLRIRRVDRDAWLSALREAA